MVARTNAGCSSRPGAAPSTLVRDATAAGSERPTPEPASLEATEWPLQRTLGNHALAAAAGAPPADAHARSRELQIIVSRSATGEADRMPAKRAPQAEPGRGRMIFSLMAETGVSALAGRVQRHERKPDPQSMQADAVALDQRKPWTVLPSMTIAGANSADPMLTYKQWRDIKAQLKNVMPPPKKGEKTDYRDERLSNQQKVMQRPAV